MEWMKVSRTTGASEPMSHEDVVRVSEAQGIEDRERTKRDMHQSFSTRFYSYREMTAADHRRIQENSLRAHLAFLKGWGDRRINRVRAFAH